MAGTGSISRAALRCVEYRVDAAGGERLRCARLVEPVVTRQVALATARNRPPVPELWDIMQTVRQSVRNTVMSGAWPGARLV